MIERSYLGEVEGDWKVEDGTDSFAEMLREKVVTCINAEVQECKTMQSRDLEKDATI